MCGVSARYIEWRGEKGRLASSRTQAACSQKSPFHTQFEMWENMRSATAADRIAYRFLEIHSSRWFNGCPAVAVEAAAEERAIAFSVSPGNVEQRAIR